MESIMQHASPVKINVQEVSFVIICSSTPEIDDQPSFSITDDITDDREDYKSIIDDDSIMSIHNYLDN